MATEYRFYHLTRHDTFTALPALLEKCRERDLRVIVKVDTQERSEDLCVRLWTYRDISFLPHGNAQDGQGDQHPIWITHLSDVPNNATVLFQTFGSELDGDKTPFELVCTLIEDGDEAAVLAARAGAKNLQADNEKVVFWQQGAQGWQQVS
ncbi:MAG: DNA polymerase III subunit chi [Pseudomonadota bacterium]